MRVTQIIKDAITTSIEAKCEIANKEYKEALSEEMDRLGEAYNQLMQEFKDEYKKAFMSMLGKLDSKNISYSCSNYSGETKDKEGLLEKNYSSPYLSLTSDVAEDLKNQISANELRAQKYINDIILELELGANKSDLAALLNNVIFCYFLK